MGTDYFLSIMELSAIWYPKVVKHGYTHTQTHTCTQTGRRTLNRKTENLASVMC